MKNIFAPKMEKIVGKLNDYLCRKIGEGNYLLTDVEDIDAIWGYTCFDCNQIDELQVKGIHILNGEVLVLMDHTDVKYDYDELKSSSEWDYLQGGDLLSVQTAYYIADGIDKYFEKGVKL